MSQIRRTPAALAVLLGYESTAQRVAMPERVLACAVLQAAVEDAIRLAGWMRRGRTDTDIRVRVRYAKLRAWFVSDAMNWPYRFRPLCQHLGLDHGPIRAYVLARMPPHSIADVRLPKRYPATSSVDWRDRRIPLGDRMWAWVLAQPGEWRMVDLARALKVDSRVIHSRLKWPTQTGRVRKLARGWYEVVREGRHYG